MQKFNVLRQHIGDQFYDPDGAQGPAVREADASSVAHLVEAGVLEPVKTKAAAGAPENKGQTRKTQSDPAAVTAKAEGK